MQRVEATSGASRAARGSTGTLAAHGRGEERRGMRRHPSRGQSGLHIVCGGVSARESNMDMTLSALATWTARETFRRQEANDLPTCIPLEAAACLVSSVKKAVAWPPIVLNSMTENGMKRMSERLLTPSEYFSSLVFSSRRRATSGVELTSWDL
jgi:hypothetical protein